MKKRAVYTAFGEQLFNLGGIPDQQAAELGIAYDPEDERHMRHVIRCVMAPYFHRWDKHSQQALRPVLAEVIVEHDAEWLGNAWEADLPPVSLPSDPVRFIQVLWDELWPGEDPAAYVLPDAEVDADPTICNQMRVAPAKAPEVCLDLLDLPHREGSTRHD